VTCKGRRVRVQLVMCRACAAKLSGVAPPTAVDGVEQTEDIDKAVVSEDEAAGSKAIDVDGVVGSSGEEGASGAGDAASQRPGGGQTGGGGAAPGAATTHTLHLVQVDTSGKKRKNNVVRDHFQYIDGTGEQAGNICSKCNYCDHFVERPQKVNVVKLTRHLLQVCKKIPSDLRGPIFESTQAAKKIAAAVALVPSGGRTLGQQQVQEVRAGLTSSLTARPVPAVLASVAAAGSSKRTCAAPSAMMSSAVRICDKSRIFLYRPK